jgi:hypothetical protein
VKLGVLRKRGEAAVVKLSALLAVQRVAGNLTVEASSDSSLLDSFSSCGFNTTPHHDIYMVRMTVAST